MPFVVSFQQNPEESQRASLTSVWIVSLIAAIYSLFVGVLLDFVVPLLYGRQYQVSARMLALVTLIVFSRFCRSGLSGLFLAHSRTGYLTAANLVSGVGLLIGFGLGILYNRVEAVLLGVLIGDVLSFLALLKFASPRLPVGEALRHLALLALPAVLAAIGALAGDSFKIEARVLIVAIAALIIGLDTVIAYRRLAWTVA
jgi:hypothetical protein